MPARSRPTNAVSAWPTASGFDPARTTRMRLGRGSGIDGGIASAHSAATGAFARVGCVIDVAASIAPIAEGPNEFHMSDNGSGNVAHKIASLPGAYARWHDKPETETGTTMPSSPL